MIAETLETLTGFPQPEPHGVRFYLGTHRPNWLWSIHDVPLFISHRRLKDRKSPYPRATTPWALDSGGFTELNQYGGWNTTAEEYVAAVRRYDEELGHMEWAAPQDWMCEPDVLAKTGLTIADHQQRTLDNYLELIDLAPDLGFIPVLQGWTIADYLSHAEAYEAVGVSLSDEQVVGVGSVCRRQATSQIAALFDALAANGLPLHGFGVKSEGLAKSADFLVSADSLAWSAGARRDAFAGKRHCSKKTCANCLHYALAWRKRVLQTLDTRQHALSIYGGAA